MTPKSPYFTDMDLPADMYAKRLMLGKVCEFCAYHDRGRCFVALHKATLKNMNDKGVRVEPGDTCHHWKKT
jgi:hypothetical protein